MNKTSSPAISLEGVRKSFGTVRAVDDLDLSVPRGQMLAFLGPNGAGKSTTTEMILGIQRPDAGRITVLGQHPSTAMRAGAIGAMLQNGVLLDTVKVKQLLTLMRGLHLHPLKLDDVIERAGIGDLLNQSCAKLSGGQAQRVRTALALLPNPDLLLLDEPTVGMDVETRRRFWVNIQGIAAEGRTIVFATHYLDEADEYADRVVVISDGRIVADGTGSTIKQSVGGRILSFVPSGDGDWAALNGVQHVDQAGHRVALRCGDSDAALRALLAMDPAASEIEISAARLEDAFVQLTSHAA